MLEWSGHLVWRDLDALEIAAAADGVGTLGGRWICCGRPEMNADIVVVGNGVIGQAVACELRRQDASLRVTLIGPAARTGGASAAAAAMLSCFGEVTELSLASEPGRSKLALALEAHRRWPALLDLLDSESPGAPRIKRVNGTYVILNSRSGDLDSANFRALKSSLSDHGEPFDHVDEVPGLDPVPDGRPLVALHLPNEGAVDSRAVLARFEGLNRRLGVEVEDTTVRRLRASDGRVTGDELADGRTIDSAQVVVAAGAFSSPLLGRCYPRMPSSRCSQGQASHSCAACPRYRFHDGRSYCRPPPACAGSMSFPSASGSSISGL